LLGTFVDDDALDGIFLGRTEYPTVTLGATTTGWADGCPIAFFESVDGGSYRRVGQIPSCVSSTIFMILMAFLCKRSVARLLPWLATRGR
jgi:hypothetical protein